MSMQPYFITGFGGRIAFLIHLRAMWITLALVGMLLIILVASLMSGTYPLPLMGIWDTLSGNPPSQIAETVVWEFRFPRTIVAALSGALFGLSGAVLQNVTRNPLADPSLVGVSQGASFSVVALIVLFPQIDLAWRPVMAFAGALAVAALIQTIAMKRSGGATMRFILTGIGVAALISALTSALLTYGDVEKAQSALGWLAGSIHSASWDDVALLTVCTGGLIPVLFWANRAMSALRMGPEAATGLGVRVRSARVGLITLAVALAAFAVSAVGPLGFVGLVAPHLSRRIAHSGVGQHLILTGLVGAVMVCLSDYIGRIAFAPIQIPAGILTAIIGAPAFMVLILRSQYNRQL